MDPAIGDSITINLCRFALLLLFASRFNKEPEKLDDETGTRESTVTSDSEVRMLTCTLAHDSQLCEISRLCSQRSCSAI